MGKIIYKNAKNKFLILVVPLVVCISGCLNRWMSEVKTKVAEKRTIKLDGGPSEIRMNCNSSLAYHSLTVDNDRTFFVQGEVCFLPNQLKDTVKVALPNATLLIKDGACNINRYDTPEIVVTIGSENIVCKHGQEADTLGPGLLRLLGTSITYTKGIIPDVVNNFGWIHHDCYFNRAGLDKIMRYLKNNFKERISISGKYYGDTVYCFYINNFRTLDQHLEELASYRYISFHRINKDSVHVEILKTNYSEKIDAYY